MEASNGGNECVNIVLLGETGNGKSTLINSFANYQAYKSFDDAKSGPEVCLIPTKFTFLDEAMNETLVQAGSEDENECLEVGESATMSCKSYVFQLTQRQHLRIIDSSGFAATQGIGQDQDTVNDVIDYVSQFRRMHALAIVVKANQNTLSSHFEHCLEPILEAFGPLAVQNIIIILTHCKKPNQTLKLIKDKLNKMCKELKMVEKEIVFNKENIFCFENEVFRNVLAAKHGAEVTSIDNKKLWELATKECQRLISNLCKKRPLQIPITLAQTQVFAQSLSSIAEIIISNIQFNLQNLMEINKEWMISPQRFNSIDPKLRIVRIVEINVEAVDRKIIVCHKCVGSHKLADETTYCCAGCKNSHWKSSRCKKMSYGMCSACKCKAKHHVECAFQITKTETEMYESSCEYKDAAKMVEEYIVKLVDEKNKLFDGIKLLIDFLIVNSVSIKKKTSHSADKKIVKRLYHSVHKQKLKFDKYKQVGKVAVSAEEMQDTMKKLKALQIYGAKITSAYQAEEAVNQRNRRQKEVTVQSKRSFFK